MGLWCAEEGGRGWKERYRSRAGGGGDCVRDQRLRGLRCTQERRKEKKKNGRMVFWGWREKERNIWKLLESII